MCVLPSDTSPRRSPSSGQARRARARGPPAAWCPPRCRRLRCRRGPSNSPGHRRERTAAPPSRPVPCCLRLRTSAVWRQAGVDAVLQLVRLYRRQEGLEELDRVDAPLLDTATEISRAHPSPFVHLALPHCHVAPRGSGALPHGQCRAPVHIRGHELRHRYRHRRRRPERPFARPRLRARAPLRDRDRHGRSGQADRRRLRRAFLRAGKRLGTHADGAGALGRNRRRRPADQRDQGERRPGVRRHGAAWSPLRLGRDRGRPDGSPRRGPLPAKGIVDRRFGIGPDRPSHRRDRRGPVDDRHGRDPHARERRHAARPSRHRRGRAAERHRSPCPYQSHRVELPSDRAGLRHQP